uniref:SEFIR domain-containing protein n=1 Tax=Strigamia maritima TaxID=126957 RepID=T1IJ73_STRMM
MNVKKNSVGCVMLVLILSGLCLCTQNPNKNKRFNCHNENIQTCTLTNDFLSCSSSNFSIQLLLPNDRLNFDEISELPTQEKSRDNLDGKCYLSWNRRKAKNHLCAIITENDVQKRAYKNRFCSCHCIVHRKILEIKRRDVSGILFNVSYHVAPIPETLVCGLVDVDLHLTTKIDLDVLIYGLKRKKSGHCNGKRIYETNYNLSSLDEKVIQFSFSNASKPGNYCLRLIVSHGQYHKSFDKFFEMDFSAFNEPQVLHNEIKGLSRPIKVLIIYGSDIETVKMFANVLERCFNCIIVGDWILQEKRKIAESMALWVTNIVEICDKIIVVNCKTTNERQELYLKPLSANTNTTDLHYMYPLFDHFLSIAHSKAKKYRNKIFNIRFFGTSNDCTLKDIGIETGSLEIPLQLEELFIWLHDLNPKNVAENLDVNWQKNEAFKELCRHLNVVINSEEAENSTREMATGTSGTELFCASKDHKPMDCGLWCKRVGGY